MAIGIAAYGMKSGTKIEMLIVVKLLPCALNVCMMNRCRAGFCCKVMLLFSFNENVPKPTSRMGLSDIPTNQGVFQSKGDSFEESCHVGVFEWTWGWCR